jgi:hypothetical protein
MVSVIAVLSVYYWCAKIAREYTACTKVGFPMVKKPYTIQQEKPNQQLQLTGLTSESYDCVYTGLFYSGNSIHDRLSIVV